MKTSHNQTNTMYQAFLDRKDPAKAFLKWKEKENITTQLFTVEHLISFARFFQKEIQ